MGRRTVCRGEIDRYPAGRTRQEDRRDDGRPSGTQYSTAVSQPVCRQSDIQSSMLPLLSSPFSLFFLPALLFFKGCTIKDSIVVHMRARAQENRYDNACEHLSKQRQPVPCSLARLRCARSHALDTSGGFLWRGALSSPTPFYPCGLSPP